VLFIALSANLAPWGLPPACAQQDASTDCPCGPDLTDSFAGDEEGEGLLANVDNSIAVRNAMDFWLQARGPIAEVHIVTGNTFVCGTAFLVNDRCLLTCAHVVAGEAVTDVKLWFKYEDDVPPFQRLGGCEKEPCDQCLKPDEWSITAAHIISPREALDIAVLEAKPRENGGQSVFPGQVHGHVRTRTRGPERDERVHHIHHPDGRCKECAGDAAAIVSEVNDQSCVDSHPNSDRTAWFRHWADGEKGSSGCPVFDDLGVVIGMSTGGNASGSHCAVKIQRIERAVQDFINQPNSPLKACPFDHFESTAAYAIVDLGTLGGPESSAVAINRYGHVAGSAKNAQGAYRAFRYTGCALTELPTLGGHFSEALGMNDAGTVVGGAATAAGVRQAFLFVDRNENNQPDKGEMINLGTLGGSDSDALDVDQNGLYIVGWSDSPQGSPRACAWWVDGEHVRRIDMGTLRADTKEGHSAAGAIISRPFLSVGWADTEPGPKHACAWEDIAPRRTQDLGTLPGATESMARDVIATTTGKWPRVVGYSTLRGEPGRTHAVLWRHDEDNKAWTIRDLGTLRPNNAGNSDAHAINRTNRIVGWSDVDGGGRHAFLHDGIAMHDLNALVPAGSGWVLEEARGINERGQIVGFGRKDKAFRAFLLVPARAAPGAGAPDGIAGDLDGDGELTVADLELLRECYTGPDVQYSSDACAAADLDRDGDVDLDDFELFWMSLETPE
jgi:probable HAF family extracellular repeat protein